MIKSSVTTLFALFVIFSLITSSMCLAQSNIPENNDQDFARIKIGPEFGTNFAIVSNTFKAVFPLFHYSIGGFLKFRPVHSVEFETGLQYNVIDINNFYEIPLLLHIYSVNDRSFLIGPNIIYGKINENWVRRKPEVGISVGYGLEFSDVILTYYPASNLLFHLKHLISIGIDLKYAIIKG